MKNPDPYASTAAALGSLLAMDKCELYGCSQTFTLAGKRFQCRGRLKCAIQNSFISAGSVPDFIGSERKRTLVNLHDSSTAIVKRGIERGERYLKIVMAEPACIILKKSEGAAQVCRASEKQAMIRLYNICGDEFVRAYTVTFCLEIVGLIYYHRSENHDPIILFMPLVLGRET
ncbi:hypothetical protein EDD18DRAFT_1106853 [Armillaria luteobubalina]|uniref:Uncharacterized protein n=1 Tax=Armillaria luteobubalina TaxID=153913 RepID=A0AA39Q2G5_9AGAR|nr:hypothetical protein EDD18DRAFT_1106853 [Armillaria luteobubalina]